jgi:D-alanyl-D-alanine carboxypeptidase
LSLQTTKEREDTSAGQRFSSHTIPPIQSLLLIPEENSIDYRKLADDDLQKFVSKDMPFDDVLYVPSDLVTLSTSESLHVQGNRTLRSEASLPLLQLSQAFYQTFHQPLVVMSAYRSYAYQKNQIAASCKQSGYCAKEGESEHQLGLAVDLREATNAEKFLIKYQDYYEWLREHAHEYGFHQSYQKGKETDGYAIEPRHWRYLGKELATLLWEKKLTFSEWVKREM